MTLAALLPINVPLINGVAYSFQHIELRIAGLKFTGGFSMIDYDRERKRDMVMSNSSDPVSKTQGENEYKCEAEMYLAWWLALLRTVAANLGSGYGDQPFLITVSYNANGFSPTTDVIRGCTFDSTSAPNQVGTKPLTRKVKFSPLKILFDGKDDLASPLQALPF